MPAANYDILIEKGATFRLGLTWRDANGTPVDLTNWSARMQIRESINDAEAAVDLSSPSAGIALGGTAGTISVTITAAQTAALTIRRGVYDLEVQDIVGNVTRLLQGAVEVSPEVTR